MKIFIVIAKVISMLLGTTLLLIFTRPIVNDILRQIVFYSLCMGWGYIFGKYAWGESDKINFH